MKKQQKDKDYHADDQQENDIIILRLKDKNSVKKLHETLFEIFGE